MYPLGLLNKRIIKKAICSRQLHIFRHIESKNSCRSDILQTDVSST